MPHSKRDVVDHALGVLDRHGLADLSMRRLAADLGVQPSALYWHVASKQELLAAVADEVLRRGDRPVPDGTWNEQVVAHAHALREAMLAYRDGAELVAAAHAFGLGEIDLAARLRDLTGHPIAAATVLYFVLGHVQDEQLQLQAGSAGALDTDPLARADTFSSGLDIVVSGIIAQRSARR